MATGGDDRGAWVERAAASADPHGPSVALPRELIGEVFAHAVECYPEECCGVAIGLSGATPERVVRCTNVQSRRFARGESTLDAGRAFWIDEGELLEISRAADSEGRTIRMIYHSHIDTPAYFSRQDLAGAVGSRGEPLYAHAAQLVVAVYDGVVREAALFEWDAAAGAYGGRHVRQAS